MKKVKLLLAVSFGVLSVALLRNTMIGSAWAIFFMLLVLFHFSYERAPLNKIKLLKLGVFVLGMIGILTYGKGSSLAVAFIGFLSLIGNTSSKLTSYSADFFYGLTKMVKGVKGYSFSISSLRHKNSVMATMAYVAVPILIVLLFGAFYSVGSVFLSDFLYDFFTWVDDTVLNIFRQLNLQWFFWFFFGIVVFSAVANRVSPGIVVNMWESLPSNLMRKRRKRSKNGKYKHRPFHTNPISLRIELKLGVIVLVCLNVLLLVTNVLDVKNIWFDFNPSEVLLSKFVHEGTYVLIFTIILASVVLLFYFRGSVNFLRDNVWIKRLAYAWIFQNVVLAVSVGLRNYHYVNQMHALTDKRIGVFLFLCLVLMGLFTLYLKIERKKTIVWLLKTNSFVLIAFVAIMQLANWERLIISYNFSNPNPRSIDMDQLFDEIDYDLVYLGERIKETPELLFSKRGLAEKWQTLKSNYFLTYEESAARFWNYHKHRNLKCLDLEVRNDSRLSSYNPNESIEGKRLKTQ